MSAANPEGMLAGRRKGALRDFVLALKARGSRSLADEFGRRPAGRVARKVDLVLPVPGPRWKPLFRTTGATANAGTEALRAAGAAEVRGALAAR